MREIKFVQITDLHLLGNPKARLHNIPITEVHLKIIDKIKNIESEIEFILITGDISENGSEESYFNAREIFSGLSKPIYWIAGNHDNMDAIHLFNNRRNIKSKKSFSTNAIHFILLNSVAPSPDGGNRSRGVLSNVELTFLKNEIEQNPTKQIVIALHHPPIKSGTWKDDRMLQNANDFFEVINQFDNQKLVLYGHQHQENETIIGNTKFYSPPAASFQFDKNIKWAFENSPSGYGIITIANAFSFACESRYIEYNLQPIYEPKK